MDASIAELLLAYRQAKVSLHQEQHGPMRLIWAREEQRLPTLLANLQRHLARSPGWFTRLNPGQVWLVPKKATAARTRTGVANIGGDYRSRLASLTVRPHLTPSVDFAVVEVLWLWQFGAALESLLGPDARGNRLKLINDRRDFSKHSLGCFEFWPTAYRSFREEGFAVARDLLKRGRARCLVATFDLASYYDEVDPTFLVQQPFVAQIIASTAARAITFDAVEYVTATRSLLLAFRRYRAACRGLTGVSVERGIPIGCLTSKLIANLVLAPLDQHVRSNAAVRYYARYVDDMLLVADASRRSPSTSRRIARLFLPISAATGSERGEMLLNAEALGRSGCRLRLQPSKLRGYVLTGRRGRDFLDTIERDVKLIASERRAFLLPDGLGSESPLTALFVGSDDDTPVQVLREVDRLKVERYAASVAISKAAVGVELLDPNESAKWCYRQLSPLAGHLTSPEQWLEFLDLSLRALTVCIRASDVSTARSILRRHTVHFARLGSVRPRTAITWNGKAVAWPTVRRNLLRWYQNRRVEDIVASVPLSELGPRTARPFVRRLVGRYLRIGDAVLGPSAIASRARLLRAADLRTVDRETDLQRLPTPVRVATRRWENLDAQLRADDLTSTRIAQIDQFLNACREIADPIYESQSAIDVLLMTRPPTQFDIASRWAKANLSMDQLSSVTNGVRGNRYRDTVIRQRDAQTIDVTTLASFFAGKMDDIQLVLGNLRTEVDWWTSAAKGKQVVTRRRMAGIGRIVNEAIRLRHRRKQPTLLVLPELSLPARLLRPLAYRLVQEDISLIAGLEYSQTGAGVVNEAVGVFAPGFKVAGVWWWPKMLPARGELRELLKLGIGFVNHQGSPMVVQTDFGAISVLICSELLDVRARGSLLGRIDLLAVPSWNPDTATFDHTIQTTANDLHCFVAVANNALYSDSRVQVPSEQRHERDACRLISRTEDSVIAVVISPDQLRKFQLASLANPLAKVDGFKPIPPGYEFKR